jgi:outer membrane receptor for ferrienterochelin and colicins
MKKLILICILNTFAVLPITAQQLIRVISAENSEQISGVKLFIQSQNSNNLIGTTDSIGYFYVTRNLFHTDSVMSILFEHPDFEIQKDELKKGKNKTIVLYAKSQKLDEVIVTAQIGSEKVENAIQKITLISREMIDAKGATNLRDVLQNEMNIRINQDQVLGSSLTIKGMGGEGVKIMIDGVPVVGRNDGNIDLSQINLSNIERIEIIEGPLSVNYGSNAIAGTINLITKRSRKPGHSTSMNSLYESSGYYNLNLGYNLTKGKHSISISGGRNYFDGWINDDPQFEFPKEKPADSSRFKSWKPKEQFTSGIRYSYNIKSFQFNPYVDLFSEKIINRGYPRPPYQIIAFDDTYKTNRFNSGLNFNGRIKSKYTLKGQLAYNDYKRIKNTYITDLTTLDNILSTNQGDQDTSSFNLMFVRLNFGKYQSYSKLNYETGLELNYETGTGTRIDENEKQIADLAFFGLLEWAPIKISR